MHFTKEKENKNDKHKMGGLNFLECLDTFKVTQHQRLPGLNPTAKFAERCRGVSDSGFESSHSQCFLMQTVNRILEPAQAVQALVTLGQWLVILIEKT